jgi:hypothetical protein
MQTTRDNIYKKLNTIEKLIIPKTIKITPRSPIDISRSIKDLKINFPLLFRQAGDHGGVSTVVLESYIDIVKKMYQFPLDGREYYLTQYYDYGIDGIYKKYRLVVVEGKVYLRHLIFSDYWMIHARSRKFMDKHPLFKEKERDMQENFEQIVKPMIEKTIYKIYETLPLDYFGIDCSIDKEGNICIFELNANMNVLTNNMQSLSKYVSKINNAIIKMIEKRMMSQ